MEERKCAKEEGKEREMARYGFHRLGTGVPGRHADAKVRNPLALCSGLSLMYLFIEALILFFFHHKASILSVEHAQAGGD